MEYIKNFIVTLVTTIIFITAIEIISPDKPIKKYIKFYYKGFKNSKICFIIIHAGHKKLQVGRF